MRADVKKPMPPTNVGRRLIVSRRMGFVRSATPGIPVTAAMANIMAPIIWMSAAMKTGSWMQLLRSSLRDGYHMKELLPIIAGTVSGESTTERRALIKPSTKWLLNSASGSGFDKGGSTARCDSGLDDQALSSLSRSMSISSPAPTISPRFIFNASSKAVQPPVRKNTFPRMLVIGTAYAASPVKSRLSCTSGRTRKKPLITKTPLPTVNELAVANLDPLLRNE